MSLVDGYGAARREEREQRIAFLIKAAEMHLDRVTTLSNREWQTKIVYWGALLASGAALIGSASRANPAVANAIAHWDFLIVCAYYVSATVYLVGYSGNMHQSLVTERNRYQLMQDAAGALSHRQTPYVIAPFVLTRSEGRWRKTYDPHVVYRSISRWQLMKSAVWGVKVMGTALFITSIWTISQVAAHAQYVTAKHRQDVCATYQATHPALDQASSAFDCDRVAAWQPVQAGDIVLRCAFMVCEKDRHPAFADWRKMEVGTVIAGMAAFIFLAVGLFAWVSSAGP